MREFIFDTHRVLLLFWKSAKWLLPYFFARLFFIDPGKEAFGIRLRSLIAEMGATYVKLGQYLAIRYDIFGVEICNELSKLMNEVPPVEFEKIQKQVEAELGGTLEALFQDFSRVSVAAASIAQVHKATARDGRLLAVKVMRPGVERTLRTDLRTLRRVVRLASALQFVGDLPLDKVVDELTESTLREIDFMREGHNAFQMAQEAPDFVYVPEIRWDLTTKRVLSMEFIEAVSLLDVYQLAENGHPDAFEALLPGVRPETVVSNVALACLIQAYVNGRFHGDPHPANILVLPDGRIVFVDFGICGELTVSQRELLSQFTVMLAQGRLQEAFGCYESLIIYGPNSDLERFREETLAILRRWYVTSTSTHAGIEEKVGVKYQIEMLGVMSRTGVRMQPDQLLFWRSQAVLDATAHRLPIEFDMLKTVADFFKARNPPHKVVLDQFRPEKLDALAANYIRLAQSAAPNLELLLSELTDGRFKLKVKRSQMSNERLANTRIKLLSVLILFVGVMRLWLSELSPSVTSRALGTVIFPLGLLILAFRMLILARRLS